MASPRRSTSRAVNPVQLVSLLVAYLLVAGAGGVLTAGLVMPAIAAAGATSEAGNQLFDDLPTELGPQTPSERTTILAADGSHLATYYARNRIVVPLDQISQYMRDAVVATEDRRFYEHSGVDIEGIMRGAVSTLSGDIQGASTLTQQYVKNVLIEAGDVAGDEEAIEAARETSLGRKLREAKLAIALEKVMTKDQILEGYLNIAQFGASQYGVEAASQFYFGHSAADLTLPEAALIAGITQSPGKYDPVRDEANGYENSTNRRNTVLYLMFQQGYITQEEHDAAVAIAVPDMLHITQTPVGCQTAGGGVSAFFCQYVTEVLLNDPILGETEEERRQALNRGGLTVTTTLQPPAQQAAYDSLTGRVPVNDPSYNSRQGELGVSGAISTVEPGTGNIVAMVQNTPFGQPTAEQPRATRVNYNVDRAYGGGDGFQTGSTFKAFVLTQWLIDGHTLSDVVNGSNGQVFPANSWTISCYPNAVSSWPPKNLESGASGQMTVLRATQESINTAFAYMANQDMDLCALRDTAARMGVHVGTGTVQPNGQALFDSQAGEAMLTTPSMVLGANTIAPLTMAAAFATYASGGVYCEPRAITSITDTNGEAIPVPEPECSQALEPHIAAAATYAMQQVVQNGTATSAQIGRPLAGKTGTANDDYHAWFIGYTPQLATAVWTGHHEGNISMFDSVINGRYYSQVFGGALPAPIFSDYMSQVMAPYPVEDFPRAGEREIYGDLVQVPGVIGQDLAAAQQTLTAAGFQVQVAEPVTSDQAAGTVAEMDPAEGSRVRPGTTITLRPSSGPEEEEEDDDDRGNLPPVIPPGGGDDDDRGGGGGNGGGDN
ncbi:glycosyl transferase family 51 [Beutenbergia cavernae DSM 12333]|uniref:Glycosyl transferase family 51 n=1 Tax=Beutenbergia cavernae (strain ATCC BAA-8 / DSM 12333 / CCUG 43141 / JCM 11478 / NBRC 16432 / NCIMB 13614 / HKI 0122) TaxID=471853 RepID=C5BXX2_BEUC1|nr:penicillin-binding protein [Beutenbergia cavernae]ACQ78866.1 glycosyl transferase family 51 [Beutenbergia cavernae DSM 12333]